MAWDWSSADGAPFSAGCRPGRSAHTPCRSLSERSAFWATTSGDEPSDSDLARRVAARRGRADTSRRTRTRRARAPARARRIASYVRGEPGDVGEVRRGVRRPAIRRTLYLAAGVRDLVSRRHRRHQSHARAVDDVSDPDLSLVLLGVD